MWHTRASSLDALAIAFCAASSTASSGVVPCWVGARVRVGVGRRVGVGVGLRVGAGVRVRVGVWVGV